MSTWSTYIGFGSHMPLESETHLHWRTIFDLIVGVVLFFAMMAVLGLLLA